MRANRLKIGVIASLTALLAVGLVSGRSTSAAEGLTVSIGDQVGLERDDVIGSIFMPVTLSQTSTEPVVVNYYTVNDTAIYIPPEDRDASGSSSVTTSAEESGRRTPSTGGRGPSPFPPARCRPRSTSRSTSTTRSSPTRRSRS